MLPLQSAVTHESTAMQTELRDDIPPPFQDGRKTGSKYNLHQLTKVGQSLRYPPGSDYRRINNAVYMWSTRNKWFASVRRQPDGSIVVWRVANEE